MPRILAIDDDDMVRMMLADILGDLGYEIIQAVNGKDGLDKFRQERPDVVLLDVMMPVMDGFACLEELRKQPGTDLLPIVMLTAAEDTDSIKRSFDLGATDFIPKPINWLTLPHRIDYMLRSSDGLAKLAKNEAVLRSAQRIARMGNWEWDVNADIMRWSDEVFRIMDVKPENFIGTKYDFCKAMHAADVDKFKQALENCIERGSAFNMDFSVTHSDRSEHVLHIQAESMLDESNKTNYLQGMVQDITEYRRIKDQVRYLSYYDALTGLPNRALYKEILGQAIAYCERYKALIASLFVGIEKFKRINEVFGPNVGDQVLRMFAERLVHAVRDSDYVSVHGNEVSVEQGVTTVSRMGGNEFTVLLNHVEDPRDTIKVINRIIHAMAEPFVVEGNEVFLAVNIGVAVYPSDGDDVDDLIKHGELAMHYAASQGRNNYQFYNESLNVEAAGKLSLENDLRRAIERDELFLVFQPKIHMPDKRIVGAEALVRWQHPTLGLVPPGQFIPLAESSGLIGEVGDWVMVEACAQIRRWKEAGYQPVPVSVNVSSIQFQQNEFVQKIVQVLEQNQLAPELLEIEITESMLLSGIKRVMDILTEIRKMGVQVSIDDFGTGYSSLSYLKNLPVGVLKVDRSFVMDIQSDASDAAVTKAILAMAASLGLDVVAEGVEDEFQSEFLQKNGCNVMQGFLFSRPVLPDEIAKWLET